MGGRMNYKGTRTLNVGFSLKLTCWRTLRHVFKRFYRLEIHSLMVGIFYPACELLAPWTKELYLCTVAPLPSLWPPPNPKVNVKNMYRQWVVGGGWGGVELCEIIFCRSLTLCFLTRFRTYNIATPPQTKMISKDDIYGLVSLKFIRPWAYLTTDFCPCPLPP